MKKIIISLVVLMVIGLLYAQSDHWLSLFISQRIVMNEDATTSSQSSEIYFETDNSTIGGTEVIYSSTADQLDIDATTEVEITATTLDINAGIRPGYVVLSDGNNTLTAANSGKVHIIPNSTADDTITFPTAVAELQYEFIYGGGAADAQDHLFDTGADANFFIGGVVQLDPGDSLITNYYSDGNSNSKFNILTPEGGTRIMVISDGTHWYIYGQLVSDTDTGVTFNDQ